MNKKDLRKKQLAILNEFALTGEKKKEDQKLLNKLINSKLLENAQTIGITSSLNQEVDTSKIIAHLWDLGKEVYLARTEPNRVMHFVYYTYRSKLTKNKMGIEEITDQNAEVKDDLDLLLVPGLAFALDSHQRLGFGGGFYDRFLEKHAEIKTVSLVNSKMMYETAIWPLDQTDIPVETLVTTDKIITN
ncbi:5-formyltetrahydrofolate cyclo-ligase [Lactobacillus kalixensis]|uniref:5-formyltetrahydrofolate cyclo-ligase n=1 Tax=Lactobacillus kalixensis TaxID=227944 RepID=UPI00070AA1F3|nr:5-formyltetrahydrofolate cyclo-ligase [Lactobacillus kalixensis]